MDHGEYDKPVAEGTARGHIPGRRARRRRLKLAGPDEFAEKSRVFMYQMAEMLCRILPAYNDYFQGDMAKFLLVNALAAANVQRLMTSPLSGDYEDIETRIPAELQVPANALSLAEATGMPRETVRRKLKELLAGGMLVEDERGGYRLRPGALQAQELLGIYFANFKAMGEVMEACVEAGLIEGELSGHAQNG